MLELKEVTKKFGDRTILDHVDLTVRWQDLMYRRPIRWW